MSSDDERLEEVLLLLETLLVFHQGDLERVHGDGMLLGVRDVGAVEIAADALVGVAGVHHHHVRALLYQLAHHAVHVEFIWKPYVVM